MNTDKTSLENEIQPSCLGAVSGSLSHGEELKRIRQKCLDSKHPLRFIQYSIEEKWYMNERNHRLGLNCH